jgi:hypothetical protein
MDFDFRRDSATDRLVVIECNPRFPGSLKNKMWAGSNLALAGVGLELGLDVHGADAPAIGEYRVLRPRNLAMVLGRRWWSDELAPTRAGWRFHLRDPLYAADGIAQRAARAFLW